MVLNTFISSISYLFIWLHQVLAAAWGIFSWGMQTLSCGLWDLVPWPGIEPGTPALAAQCLSYWTTREVLEGFLKIPSSENLGGAGGEGGGRGDRDGEHM